MSELISLNLQNLEKKELSPIVNKKTIMKEYGISHQTLHTWMFKKNLKHYKIGTGKTSKVIFKRKDIDNWMENYSV
tara:strand:- start:3188 stop:3415 length:228 start_codon:yes stop_codon:yes gene_type:complete